MTAPTPTKKYPPKGMEAFKSILRPGDYIAVEATGNSRFSHAQVSSLVTTCAVVNTRQFKVIEASASKTDSNDACALTLFSARGSAALLAHEGRGARAGQQHGTDPRPAGEAPDLFIHFI
jgi:transposase